MGEVEQNRSCNSVRSLPRNSLFMRKSASNSAHSNKQTLQAVIRAYLYFIERSRGKEKGQQRFEIVGFFNNNHPVNPHFNSRSWGADAL